MRFLVDESTGKRLATLLKTRVMMPCFQEILYLLLLMRKL